VSLDDPTNVTPTAASLSGLVSNADLTRFEYGTTTAYGRVTATRHQDDAATAAAHERLIGLQPNTTYHYRLQVTNFGDVAVSEDRTFTTPAAPEPSSGPPAGGGTTTAPEPPTPPADSTPPTFTTSGPLKARSSARPEP
jgi:hypothetical protein